MPVLVAGKVHHRSCWYAASDCTLWQFTRCFLACETILQTHSMHTKEQITIISSLPALALRIRTCGYMKFVILMCCLDGTEDLCKAEDLPGNYSVLPMIKKLRYI